MFKNKILKLFESPNDSFPGSVSRIGIGSQSSTQSGLQSRCPSFPLQGNQSIHEEEIPQDAIEPLQLNDITIEGYIVVKNGTPTNIRYKLIKNGVPLPVDPTKEKSKNIGHTSHQVLKKLSMLSNKIQLIKKFIQYDRKNIINLKTKQQSKIG
jgi:hypothetical protein